MPQSYSGDLRERVIGTVESGASRREAADLFEVSISSAISAVAERTHPLKIHSCWSARIDYCPDRRGTSGDSVQDSSSSSFDGRRGACRRQSPLQLTLHLIEKSPISGVCDDFITADSGQIAT